MSHCTAAARGQFGINQAVTELKPGFTSGQCPKACLSRGKPIAQVCLSLPVTGLSPRRSKLRSVRSDGDALRPSPTRTPLAVVSSRTNGSPKVSRIHHRTASHTTSINKQSTAGYVWQNAFVIQFCFRFKKLDSWIRYP